MKRILLCLFTAFVSISVFAWENPMARAIQDQKDAVDRANYDIVVDYEITNTCAGVVFAGNGDNHFVMWQVRENKITPHVNDGNWHTADINFSQNITGKHVLKLQIREARYVTTYIDDQLISDHYDIYNIVNGFDLSLGNIGTRQNGAEAANYGSYKVYVDNDGGTVNPDKLFMCYAMNRNVAGDDLQFTNINDYDWIGLHNADKQDYTFELKFQYDIAGAGVVFASKDDSNLCMWQFNTNGQGHFRPHVRRNGNWAVEDIDLGARFPGQVSVTADKENTLRIEVTNGTHAKTYLDNVLIDERDGDFRFGKFGTRQDPETLPNGEAAYFDDLNITAGGQPYASSDFSTLEGASKGEIRSGRLYQHDTNISYFTYNYFEDIFSGLHYTIETDMTIVKNNVSIVFGDNGGGYYMWQFTTRADNGDPTARIRYHIARATESWKVWGDGPVFPDYVADDLRNHERHVKIDINGPRVFTYIDNQLEDAFYQYDITDAIFLNYGKIGFRIDGVSPSPECEAYFDNVKVTDYSSGSANVVLEEAFNGGQSAWFNVDGTTTTIDDVSDNYKLHLNGNGNFIRLLQNEIVLLDENADNSALTDQTDVTVQLKRTFVADTWNTLCLPFELTEAQLKQLLGDGVKVANFAEANGETLKFETFDTSTGLDAYYPYLVKPSKSVTDPVTLTGIEIIADVPYTETQNGYSFVGTMKPTSFTANDPTIYFFSTGNRLVHPANTNPMKAFRAYLQVPGGATPAKFVVDEDITGIEAVQNSELRTQNSSAVYNLNGQLTTTKQKGVYIQNGKKFIIK